MMRLPSKIWRCAMLLGMLLSACSQAVDTPSTSAQTAQGAPGSRLTLQPCKLKVKGAGAFLEARCTTLSVAEDSAHPSGRKIDLNIAVIPAVDRQFQPDPVFLLAGGPGEAATESFPILMDAFVRLHQNRDLVLIDQRGTGGSHALRCPQSEASQSNSDLSLEDDLEEIKTCRQKLDGDPRFYTTQYAIEDLEQARQALGYESINLFGVSYGTRVALAYLRQYGQNVRTVMIDSVDAPDWELGPHNAANAQRTLDLLFQRCQADPDCNKTFPKLADEFKDLVDHLEKQPAKVSLRHPQSGEKIEMILDRKQLGFALQILSYEPETAALIPLLIHNAYQDGSYDLLLAQAITSQGNLSGSISDGLYLSVLCAEDVPFYPNQPEAVSSYLLDPTVQMKAICKAWDVPAVDASFKQAVQSERPVLLLSGEADPITPPTNAQQAAATLSESLTVVVPGMGHAVFGRGCLPRLSADFVNHGSVQGLDTRCVNQIEPQPFFINFSGSMP